MATDTSNPLAPTPLAPEIVQLSKNLSAMQQQFSQLTDNYISMHAQVKDLQEANARLSEDVYHLKATVNIQAALICTLEGELDELHQYSRRENVILTNLKVDPTQDLKSQAINLFDQLGVEITPDDISAAHVLPGKRGKPTRHVVRFTNRSKATSVFKNRKRTKDIDRSTKAKLTSTPNKGIGIMPHLTPKRAKLYGQVQSYCKTNSLDSCWVDYNSGKIFLKERTGQKATIISDTCDLLKLNSNYKPDYYMFCTPPVFDLNPHMSQSSPIHLTNRFTQPFSPSTPSIPQK